MERDRFHARKQRPSESTREYFGELRLLASKRNFVSFLEDALKDQPLEGMALPKLRERMLLDLTLGKALVLASS